MQASTRFDRAHFQGYGDFALKFEIVYYVLSSDYNRYMDIQQAINLSIYQSFDEEGIDFAYPTQSLYIDGKIQNNSEQSTSAQAAYRLENNDSGNTKRRRPIIS